MKQYRPTISTTPYYHNFCFCPVQSEFFDDSPDRKPHAAADGVPTATENIDDVSCPRARLPSFPKKNIWRTRIRAYG